MEPKWLYRLEATEPNNGLWYNASGEYHWGIGDTEGTTKCGAIAICESADP